MTKFNFANDISEKEKVAISQNGIKVYSLKSPGLHSFCLCVYARAGVMYEDKKHNGISHFVEHVVFRNINALMGGSLYDTLDKFGLTFTAATYKEFMQFCISGESSRLEDAAQIITMLFCELSDKLANGDFELEKDRIRAEIREYDEKASLDYAVKKQVWQDTPASCLITGTLGSVSKITLNKCEAERKRVFSQDNFFLYLTGNFDDDDPAAICRQIEKYSFSHPQNRDNICVLPEAWMNRSGEVITKDSAYYMVEMCFDMDTERFSKAQRSLFYDMMFAGENCRFFRELSENRGYIYSYDAKIEEYKNAGNISISYEVGYKNLYDSITVAVELFNGLKINAKGLSRAKVYYTDNACLGLDNAEELNWNMAYENYILDEKLGSIAARAARYSHVCEEDVMLLAQNVFVTKNLVVGIKGRKKKIDTAKINGILSALDVKS